MAEEGKSQEATAATPVAAAPAVPGLQSVHVGAVRTGGGAASGLSPASGYGTEDLPRVAMRTDVVDEDSLELLAAFEEHRKRKAVGFEALFKHVFLRLQALEDAMGEPAPNHEVRGCCRCCCCCACCCVFAACVAAVVVCARGWCCGCEARVVRCVRVRCVC